MNFRNRMGAKTSGLNPAMATRENCEDALQILFDGAVRLLDPEVTARSSIETDISVRGTNDSTHLMGAFQAYELNVQRPYKERHFSQLLHDGSNALSLDVGFESLFDLASALNSVAAMRGTDIQGKHLLDRLHAIQNPPLRSPSA